MNDLSICSNRRHWLLVPMVGIYTGAVLHSATPFTLGSPTAQLWGTDHLASIVWYNAHRHAAASSHGHQESPCTCPEHLKKVTSTPCLTESEVAKQKSDLHKVTKQVGSKASNKYSPDVLDPTSSLHHAAFSELNVERKCFTFTHPSSSFVNRNKSKHLTA